MDRKDWLILAAVIAAVWYAVARGTGPVETAGAGGAGGSGGAGATSALSASGGAGGAGGAGGGADYASLAAAITTLANGVALPNVQSVTVPAVIGTNQLVAGIGGQRVCVLAYAVTAGGTHTGRFQSSGGAADLWRLDLSAPAGNSGANLATAWPSYVFATAAGDGLNYVADSIGTVSVTYWQENA